MKTDLDQNYHPPQPAGAAREARQIRYRLPGNQSTYGRSCYSPGVVLPPSLPPPPHHHHHGTSGSPSIHQKLSKTIWMLQAPAADTACCRPEGTSGTENENVQLKRRQ